MHVTSMVHIDPSRRSATFKPAERSRSMVTVDAHCHVSPCWYEPVESLLFQMDRNHVEQAVLVQYMGQLYND